VHIVQPAATPIVTAGPNSPRHPATRSRLRAQFEFKRTVAPELAKLMRVALADLRLQRLDVIHAGERTYPLAPRVRAVALARVLEDVAPL
jgi:hypothetical protein